MNIYKNNLECTTSGEPKHILNIFHYRFVMSLKLFGNKTVYSDFRVENDECT